MTVEVSVVLPITLMVFWMFFSYLFYFMNCGITQGIIEEEIQKAADVRITGADYNTGKISYAKWNQKPMMKGLISFNNNGNIKAEKEIRGQLSKHLFMADIKSVKMTVSQSKVITKVQTRSNVIAERFLSIFGIHLFEYEGTMQALGDFEMEQIRGWNVLEGAMD